MELVGGDFVCWYCLFIRLWYWLNVVVVIVLLMSGLMIFNVYFWFYWGEYGVNVDYVWLEIGVIRCGEGVVWIGDIVVWIIGLFGVWCDGEGVV